MSSSNTSTDTIVLLNNVSTLLNQYLPIFIYIFGIVGNCLNVLVLSQRTLRTNPSALFFLGSSIAGIFVIISGLTSRMMSSYGLDLTLTMGWICKIRNVVLYSSRTVALWMIVFATIDRCLISNAAVRWRHLSNVKNTRRSMCLILVYTCLINAPIVYCYEANLVGVLRGCYGATYTCRLSTDLIYAFGTTLLPLLLMIIFGLLTIRNIRHVQNRIGTVTDKALSLENMNNPLTRAKKLSARRKIDRHLLKMLVVQVTLLFILTSPHAIQKVYTSFAPSLPSQSLQNAIQNFIFTMFTLSTFLAIGMPFYIYTLVGGSLFRNALIDLGKLGIQKL